MNDDDVRNELICGGNWLGAARRWMQGHIQGGDILNWGSTEIVHIPFKALESFAMEVAIAAVTEERRRVERAKLIMEGKP